MKAQERINKEHGSREVLADIDMLNLDLTLVGAGGQNLIEKRLVFPNEIYKHSCDLSKEPLSRHIFHKNYKKKKLNNIKYQGVKNGLCAK